ncbi:MAG: acyltransferase, partial [Bacteroidetes bacterium]|nr:acyltransferase [Fibrella sp.]
FRPGELLSTLFYYRNYYMVYFRGDVAAQCTKVFDIVWSLAIEEHFYIVFPLVFIAFCKRPGQLIFLMAAGVLAVLAWRVYLAATQDMNEITVYKIYHLTETRADAIMYGCLVSFILDSHRGADYLRFAGHRLTFGAAMALLLFTFVYRDATFRETYRYSLQGISMSLFVPAILYSRPYTPILNVLNTAWLATVGRLSYSIYMFHWFGVCVAEYLISPERRSLPWLLTALTLGLALSLFSYHFVEKPMNRLRKRFGSNVLTPNAVNPDVEIKSIPISS